ncbi:disulfide bond formation protein B [Candidatus Parcubacteria bacterium]|nr:disulfide bond formation protein B [Candidatus Parcubacteria bacterium]
MSFIVALIAMSGSLFYSGVAGFTPCTLCWYQRILMYPHVILLGVALWKEDKRIMDYLIALSTLGVFVSGYHYLLQIGILAPLPCSAIGYSVSCTKTFVMSLGYITIPMMSLTAFLLIVTFMVTKKLSNNRKLNTQ